MENEAVYHACRVAFGLGQDKVPWHMVLHTLRQGLGFKGNYTLGAKDFEAWPDLRELLDHLKEVR